MSRPVDLIGMKTRAVGVANRGSIDWSVARSVTDGGRNFWDNFKAGEHGRDDDQAAS
jgi:hypothetical protein